MICRLGRLYVCIVYEMFHENAVDSVADDATVGLLSPLAVLA